MQLFLENISTFVLRLKTAVKVIAIIGMVASLIGFSIAINRLTKMPATANHNTTTDAQALINDTTGDSYEDSTNSIADVPKNEEYLEDNHEEGSSDDIDLEATTVSPEGHKHWDDSIGIEDVHKNEGEEEDAIPRSKREAESNASVGTLIEGEGGPDPIDPVSVKPETSSDNVAILRDLEYDSAEVDEAGQSSVTPGSPPVTAAPKAELPSTTTTTTVSSTTDNKIEDVTSATEAEEIIEHSEDLPESKEKNVPESTDEESVHHDEDVTEEASKETETEQINVQEPHHPDSIENSLTDEDKDDGETAEDDQESGTSRASWAMTGLGVPICLLGFVANAVLLHAAKKVFMHLIVIAIFKGLCF